MLSVRTHRRFSLLNSRPRIIGTTVVVGSVLTAIGAGAVSTAIAAPSGNDSISTMTAVDTTANATTTATTALTASATAAEATPGPSWIVSTPGATIYKGQKVTIKGRSGANYKAAVGHTIALYLSIDGKWHNKGMRTADSLGEASFTFEPPHTTQWRLGLLATPTSVASYSTPIVFTVKGSKGAAVVNSAAAHNGKPYVFGAAGPNSFDCSGLTMYVMKSYGYSLPHSATQQYKYGTWISNSAAQPGDLIFFGSPGNFYHVGIHAGGGYMWDAPQPGQTVGKHKIWTSNYQTRRLV